MKNVLLFFIAVILISCNNSKSNGGFTIYDGKNVSQIYVADSEHISVKRAATDLQRDIEAVIGKKAEITHNIANLNSNTIIVGSVQNAEMQKIVAQNNISSESLKGLYDSYMMRPVNLANGVQALAIVGSDNLGTIYGIYNISEQIGVDPLYWWCDIPIEKKNNVVIENCTVEANQPTVKYRGIFINDEEALIKWSGNTSIDKTKGAISPESYKRIFELMLRLKANTVWPSMMEAGSYFFEFKDKNGVAINPKNATDYGIYIGTSHCENMARNNYAEWYEWAEEHKELFDMKLNNRGEYEFDYTVNPKAIEIYWRERLEESKNFNMIYTMGIRGVHDSPFMCRLLENPTLERRVALLQKVINLQRQMIKEVFGSEDAVPQIFVPYEETAELYNGESKDHKEQCEGLKLPEDIIIVYTEDNYGYARQLPRKDEVKRASGCGIYYHLAYQGYPSPYDWLTTMPYPLMQEELKKVYESGSKSFWIINVGDIKPAEMGIKLFMNMANNAQKYLYSPTSEYIKDEYSSIYNLNQQQTAEVAEIVEHFQSLANSNKPEFMSSFWSVYFQTTRYVFSFFSPFDFGDEAQQKINEYKALEARAKKFYDSLAQEYKAPFWHQVYYPIRASRQMCEKSYYYHKNVLYEQQGRFASVNAYKALSEKAAQEILDDLHYYNNEFMNGKWRGITDPYGDYNITERVFDIAGIPAKFIYKEKFTEQATDEIGAVCEGQAIGNEKVNLYFSSFEDNKRFIDVFNKGINPQSWEISTQNNWININKTQGSVATEERLWVSINWDKAVAGKNNGTVTVKGKNGTVNTFNVVATKFDMQLQPKSYAEGCGFVTIEAENFTEAKAGANGEQWQELQKRGYYNSSMVVKSKQKTTNAKQGATLSYNIYFETAGEFTGYVFRLPTLNEGKDKTCSVGVGIDNGDVQVLNGIRAKNSNITTTMSNGKKESRTWTRNVAAQIEKIPFVFKIDKPGYHTLTLYGIDSNIAVDRIVIATNNQTLTALNRSVVGPLISYNNIASSYSKVVPTQTIALSDNEAKINNYPNPEPLIYAKFAFSRYGNPEVWGFKTVSDMTIFDKNVNQYGWDKNDAKNITCGHNESTRIVPHWRRDNNRSKKPASFYVSLLEGNYEITIHSGMIRYYGYGGHAFDIHMNLSANGQQLMQNELFKLDSPSSKTYDIKVGRDNILKLDFSGNWSVSAIELYRK